MTTYDRVVNILDRLSLDAVLVSDAYNMRYISGFTGGTGYLVITKESRTLLTDSRYTVAAKAQAPDYDVVEISVSHGYLDCINDIILKEHIKTLGFEGNQFIFSAYETFRKALKCESFVAIASELTDMRRIKTPEELANLRMAEHIGDIAFEEILGYIKPGVTELDIAAKLEYIMKCNGAENLSFDSIVAAGVNGSKPHAEPGQNKIEHGDFVTMDFGCKYNGYCSDMTRTVCVGHASKKQKEIYETVLKAQTTVIKNIKAGRPGKEWDAMARNIITEAGYGEYFGHNLGHSVGMEIHENPRLGRTEESIIEAGIIVTVEPGIYIPGFGGVRIEDMGVVTEDGFEDFTHSRKELIEL